MTAKASSPKTSSSLNNFGKALANLERSLATPVQEPRDLSGIIKDFEMAYELSWKSLKRRLLDEGHQTLGAKNVFSTGYQLGFLGEEDVWLEMIQDRNQTAHVYDENDAGRIVSNIRAKYFSALKALHSQLTAKT